MYTPEELRNMQARYKAMCTLLSKAVGRMLRTVEDAGLLDNSIVVFMSDHGMYLGERGRTGKSGIQADARSVFPFHCEINRICWSMHVPPSLGRTTAAPGSRLAGLVQAPDLMPTVLELCGIPAPGDVDLEGSSLIPLLEGDADGAASAGDHRNDDQRRRRVGAHARAGGDRRRVEVAGGRRRRATADPGCTASPTIQPSR